MISPELIRRYPFSAGLNDEQIVTLAKSATEETVSTGEYIFREGEKLCCFYIVTQGAVAIVIEVPDKSAAQPIADQLAGELTTKDITVSTVGTGEMFGWSGLVDPHTATASAKALTPCRLIAFNCDKLRKAFEKECRFGYLMMQKAAQISRDRLRDIRIESLAFKTQ